MTRAPVKWVCNWDPKTVIPSGGILYKSSHIDVRTVEPKDLIKLTTAVHSVTQNPVTENSFCPGGIAILSVYSRPSSMTPASIGRRSGVTRNLTPELSTQSENIITHEVLLFTTKNLKGERVNLN